MATPPLDTKYKPPNGKSSGLFVYWAINDSVAPASMAGISVVSVRTSNAGLLTVAGVDDLMAVGDVGLAGTTIAATVSVGGDLVLAVTPPGGYPNPTTSTISFASTVLTPP